MDIPLRNILNLTIYSLLYLRDIELNRYIFKDERQGI
jgi:hypothetical protein